MLRAKRRRTRTHDINGNPIFNTMNSPPLQTAYVNVNNNQKQLQSILKFMSKRLIDLST